MNANKQDAGGLPNELGFEQWYVTNTFDYPSNPLGSRDCSIARKAWHAALEAVRNGEQRRDAGGLLPCPFCGESADFQRSSLPEDGEICFPLCTGCGAKLDEGPIGVGWYANEGTAAAVWNQRAELCRAASAGGDRDPLPTHHCQNGRSDICLAANYDGVCCPDDSCDIDDGVRDPRPDSAPAGSGEVEDLIDDLIQAASRIYDSGVSRMDRRLAETEISTARAALLRKLQQGAE